MKKKSRQNNPAKMQVKINKSEIPEHFDYKAPEILRKFVTERGKIIPRSRTGITAKQQRGLTRAIKRARMIALMPFAN